MLSQELKIYLKLLRLAVKDSSSLLHILTLIEAYIQNLREDRDYWKNLYLKAVKEGRIK